MLFYLLIFIRLIVKAEIAETKSSPRESSFQDYSETATKTETEFNAESFYCVCFL